MILAAFVVGFAAGALCVILADENRTEDGT